MGWDIEQLSGTHDRKHFSCGEPSLDRFLSRYAGQYQRRNLARIYVAVSPGDPAVLGYYALSGFGIPFENLPADGTKRLPEHPIPVALLGRLAVDESVQGKGLGAELLRDALLRCVGLSEQIGIFAVLVEAIDDDAARFYERYGFVRLLDQPGQLYLPIAGITGT